MTVLLPNLILFFMMLVVVGVIVLVIVGVTRSASHNAPPPTPWAPHAPNPALAALDLRYARGEIERDEYLRRRADLLGQPASFQPAPPTGPGTIAS